MQTSQDHENSQQNKLPKRYGRRLIVVSTTIVTLCLMAVTLGSFVWLNELGVLDIKKENLDPILNWQAPDNSIVYDRNGKKIGEFFTNHHIYTPYKDIPKPLIDAITSIEDRKFWKHNGVDYKAIVRAGIAYLKNNGRYTQGASTITQQIVRHFLLSKEKSIARKVKEIFLARELEKHASKERIIEIYANALFLGNRSYGVASAAWRYFGKPLDKIKLHEASLLAGLFQLPSRYNPHKNPKLAKKRQKIVLKAMVKAKVIKLKSAKRALKKKLKYKQYTTVHGSKAPYFVDYIKGLVNKLRPEEKSIKNQGLRIYTTLDQKSQNLAELAIKKNEKKIRSMENKTTPIRLENGGYDNRRVEAAMVVTSSKTGEILAMVGGRDYKKSQFNRVAQAKRSPGSAFKPIVYLTALQKNKKWSDMVYVAPITLKGSYRPKNSSADYMTETTLLRAFYKSMNTPTVNLSRDVGIKSIISIAKKIGISSEIKKEYGSALGSSDLTMLELAQAYGTMANSGISIKPTAISKITDREGSVLYQAAPIKERATQAIQPQLAFLMTQGMKSVLKFGTGFKAAELARWAAGKTGTSNNSKDNWFCGYTSELTAIVWTGTDDFTGINGDVHGSTVSLPIWKTFMESEVYNNMPHDFIQPPGLTKIKVHPKYGYEAEDGIEMWFTEHNLPKKNKSGLESLQYGGSYRNIFSH